MKCTATTPMRAKEECRKIFNSFFWRAFSRCLGAIAFLEKLMEHKGDRASATSSLTLITNVGMIATFKLFSYGFYWCEHVHFSFGAF
jgi:hypothetical protein